MAGPESGIPAAGAVITTGLCRDTIFAGLSERAVALIDHIDILPEIDSTNNFLARLPAPENRRAKVCLADRQHAGRGRRGRTWVSPPGANLYLSVAWPSTLPPLQRLSLSPLSAIAVARAMQDLRIPGVALKWPNDLYAENRKLGGILLENRDYTVIVGIGVNISMAKETGVGQPWTDLHTLCGHAPCRNTLAAATLNHLLPAFADMDERQETQLAQAWSEFDLLSGCDVVLLRGDERLTGRADGINNQGALRLHTVSGVHFFTSGEVSLRLAS